MISTTYQLVLQICAHFIEKLELPNYCQVIFMHGNSSGDIIGSRECKFHEQMENSFFELVNHMDTKNHFMTTTSIIWKNEP